MAGKSAPQPLSVKTAEGKEISVVCPICSNNTFMSVRAQSIETGAGFQHLTLGQEVRPEGALGAFVALPVRFQACANCGYILKFLMPRT
jgi:ribosomal protein S27AE